MGYLMKIFELYDTIFFILRKSFRQVTFLGVYHHTSILTIGWLSNVFDTYGDFTFVMAMNSTIHVIMYLYYTLSLLHIRCWWKKYLTLIQMIQFTISIIEFSVGLYLKCGVLWLKLLQILYMSSLLMLFMDFFKSSYKYMIYFYNKL